MFSHTPSPQQAWAVRSTNERPLKHLWHFRISGTYTTSVINTRIVWISSTSHSLFLTRNIEYWLLSVACHQPRSHRWVLPVILAQSLNTSTTNFLLYPEFPPILPFSLLLSPHHLLIYSTCHLFFFFFWERITLDISGSIIQAGLEHAIFLPLPPLCYTAGLCLSSCLSKHFSHNNKVVLKGRYGAKGKDWL